MKNTLLSIIGVAAIVLATMTSHATPTMLVGTLGSVSTTPSNSPPTTALTYIPTLQQFSVTHGALTSTNEALLYFRVTVDQTNYVVIGSWYPSFTNPCTEIVNQGQYNITNFVSVQYVATNTISIGINYGQ